MARRPRLTAAQLHDRWSTPKELDRLSDILDLREFLLQCVIKADYTISDGLNSAIVLSDYGDWLQRELGKKKIPIKESRLLCLLELFHLDVLVDIERMDPARLAKAIGEELKQNRIYLPFSHGPDLYRRAAELFPDERQSLGSTDTMRLLDGMPTGVFHLGRWISGPYGLMESLQRRLLAPTLSVPLQHCHDVACRRVHRVVLETDQTAEINEHRWAASKVLESESPEASDFGIFFGEVFRDDGQTYDDFNTGSLPLLLGDSLSEFELRQVLVRAIDANPRLRIEYKKFGLNVTDAAKFAVSLGRAELLQLLLVDSDHAIISSLDWLVAQGEIVVPDGEIRRPVLFPNAAMGAFASQVEISNHGCRVYSRNQIAPLRLRRLIDKIYASDDVNEAEELSWLLRSVPGVTLAERLDEFLRTASPRRVVDELVLARKAHTEIAAIELRIDLSLGTDMQRSELVERILWKLGFDVAGPERLQDRFWQLHEELGQSARSAAVSTTVNEEAMRGLSANYFEQLEMVLSDSLAFTSWVLTSDHWTAERPFHYDDDTCRSIGLRTVELSSCNVDGADKSALEFSEKVTLYGLSRGFGILADHLRAVKAEAEKFERSTKDHPRFTTHTSLKKFPFRHVVPFLDLVPSSQSEILDKLDDISSRLINARVSDVRNSQIHYRRAASDLRPLIESLEGTRLAVRALEDLGFVRVLFTPKKVESDEWTRMTAYLSDGRGREVVLGHPSEYSWLNLPTPGMPQYLVISAQFAEPAEVLRFTLGVPSEFTRMWDGFPTRRADSGFARRADVVDSSASVPEAQNSATAR